MTKSFYQFWTSAIILSLFVSFANSSESSGTNAAIVSPDGDIRSVSASSGKEHGVDVSWPMQHDPSNIIKSDGSHQHFFAYERYMSGCTKQADTCHYSEKDRIEMNLLQPSAMQNYTHAGYAKVPTPQVVQDMLTSVWKDHHQEQTRELWDRGNTYVNHWESPTYMVDWETHLSKSQKQNLVKQLQSVLEAWTQQSLVVTSVYGIRVYKEGSILAPHVDRLPLVSSAIINVAQDVQEPWMLQVIGHDGKARNITMKPGEMILYESHSIIHGRPFRLNGNYYANAFVHFEPLGHTLRHSQAGAYGATDDVSLSENAKKAYENALLKEQMKKVKTAPVAVQGKFQNNDKPPSGSPTLPLYVPEENQVEWNQQFDFEKEEKVSPKPTKITLGSISVHHAASDGMLDALKEIAAKQRSQLFKADRNGWTPLHEAARGGRHDVIEYLLKEGAQVNERTNHGDGANALWWAEKSASKDRPRFQESIDILKKYGAVSLGPKKKLKE